MKVFQRHGVFWTLVGASLLIALWKNPQLLQALFDGLATLFNLAVEALTKLASVFPHNSGGAQ